jgi:hypothetical protein
MVLAEKIVTAIERGAANTRWRDFADIAAIAGVKEISADDLARSITTVAEHRRADPRLLAMALEGMGALAQSRWAAWRRKQRLEDSTPGQFQELIDQCSVFADPVLAGDAAGLAWSPAERAWH